MAERLLQSVRTTDTVARLGGDEFTVIVSELKDNSDVVRIVQEILGNMSSPFHLHTEVVEISASIGITLYPEDGADAETLIKNADQAMYAAKQQGRNRFNYFAPFMQEARDLEKFRLVYGLRIMNMADMHRFMAWARRHRLDVVTLQKARRWVDITKPSIISRPPKYYFPWNVLVCVLSALSVQLGAFFADSPALLKMKATGVWFTADGTSVGGPLGGNKLDLTQCPTVSDKLQKTFGFSAAEAKVLCDARASGSLQEFTKETIGWQKKVAAFVVLASAAWLLVAILRIRSAETAERIADRVGLPKLAAPQVLESQPVPAAHSAVPPPTEQTS